LNSSDRFLGIRPAHHADLDALVELARRSWLSAFAQTAPLALIDWWARSDCTRRLYEASWPEMFVLEDGGRLLGVVQPKDAEIHGLWVSPSCQGRGVGTRLLEFGESRIRAIGERTAWLTCAAFNPRALSFYRSRGYAEVARSRYAHESGLEVEEVRLEKQLGG